MGSSGLSLTAAQHTIEAGGTELLVAPLQSHTIERLMLSTWEEGIDDWPMWAVKFLYDGLRLNENWG